jgi:hypothetical protein
LAAYARARSSGRPVPEWVLKHFDDAVKALSPLVQSAIVRRPVNEIAEKFSDAFKVSREKGKATVFAEFADRFYKWDWLALGEKVARYVRTGRYLESGAIDMVVHDLAEIERRAVDLGVIDTARPTPKNDVVRKAWKMVEIKTPAPTMPSPAAAAYIGMFDAFLRKGRMNRDPDTPPYLKIGKAVRYLKEDLDAWLRRHRIEAGEAA